MADTIDLREADIMAKRDTGRQRAERPKTMTSPMEQRLMAFAEQLGRFTGTVEAKATGWMDRKALHEQIASVRDSAAGLLAHLAESVTPASRSKAPAAAKPGGTKARSGGAVDAPGKKHRKAMPADPRAKQVDSQAAKIRTARPMEKTSRLRGRG